MAVDIGMSAINRDLAYAISAATTFNVENPANATGKITSIEIYANSNLSNVEVATFFEVTPGYYSTRDNVTIGSVTAGSKQTFTVDSGSNPISLDVQTGDFLGIKSTAGNIEWDFTGFNGIRFVLGDKIPCTNEAFDLNSDDAISLYGTGTEPIPITATSIITTSTTSALSRGITEVLTATVNIMSSTTSTLSRGITEVLTSTATIATSITSALSRGVTETFTSTANIAISITSALLRTKTMITSTVNIVTFVIGKLLKDYISLTKADRVYTDITRADRVYTPVSDVTPSGTVEEKFIWNYIVPNFDTWLELLAREHWCDWYFGTAYTDNYTSLTTPSKTYGSVTKSDKTFIPITTPDRTYTSVTTPDKTYIPVSDVTPSGTIEERFTWANIDPNYDTWVELLMKEHWIDWYFGASSVDAWTSITTPSKTYNEVTKPEDGYDPVTTPDKTYKEVNKYKVDV